jgi:hypothetical protein
MSTPSVSDSRVRGDTYVGSTAEQVAVTLSEQYSVEAGVRSRALIREKARAQRLSYYLGELSRSGLIDQYMAVLAWKAWNQLRTVTPCLLVPDASPGPDGQVLYTWDHEQDYLELEIFPSGAAEFFYRNRASGQLWGYDYKVGELNFPQEVKDRLALFTQA